MGDSGTIFTTVNKNIRRASTKQQIFTPYFNVIAYKANFKTNNNKIEAERTKFQLKRQRQGFEERKKERKKKTRILGTARNL